VVIHALLDFAQGVRFGSGTPDESISVCDRAMLTPRYG